VKNISRVTQKTATAGVLAGMMAAGAGWASPALAAAGWQTIETFNIPTGEVSLQLGYACPSAFPIAHSGSYSMNATGQVSDVFVTSNGARIDVPNFSQWAWHFYFPGGAPAGVSVLYDAYCAKK
jgi:hypothetical protein